MLLHSMFSLVVSDCLLCLTSRRLLAKDKLYKLTVLVQVIQGLRILYCLDAFKFPNVGKITATVKLHRTSEDHHQLPAVISMPSFIFYFL